MRRRRSRRTCMQHHRHRSRRHHALRPRCSSGRPRSRELGRVLQRLRDQSQLRAPSSTRSTRSSRPSWTLPALALPLSQRSSLEHLMQFQHLQGLRRWQVPAAHPRHKRRCTRPRHRHRCRPRCLRVCRRRSCSRVNTHACHRSRSQDRRRGRWLQMVHVLRLISHPHRCRRGAGCRGA